ncbi:MAG: hypothetical protein LIP77_06965 [Planctomycetes bacterium]|nr:hypothetical protein [Planctomycetota bacterium]
MTRSGGTPISNREDDLTPELFDRICRYIYDRARINLTRNKMELVRARFGKVIRQRQMSGFREYFKWMQSDATGEALREVMNAISTNLTSFFRESDHFDFLSRYFLPEMEARFAGQGGKVPLRGWSAGCSTGEEAYSLAITIFETLTRPEDWDVRLLATDIDTEVVAAGQHGVYHQDRLAGVSHLILAKYTDKCVDAKGRPAYRMKSGLRDRIAFRHLNLFCEWPFRKKFHFIFCRNVMIYFDRSNQEELVNRFYDALGPGGYLFIGHSESLSGVNHRFDYVKPTIYRKT